MIHLLVVLGVFFLSGVSGLVYQVLWVRLFGNVFGNTVYSAAAVTAVFMFGLGVGSYLSGRWSDRLFVADPLRPLRVYGYAELLIGLWCLFVALVLPDLTVISAWGSSYTPGSNGWLELSTGSYLLRCLVAIALIAPATLLMGGTLSLLIRYVVANQLSQAGWRIGLLYGFNTLGAAVGCSLTDLALVPLIGVFETELVAVALNWLAGGIALVLAVRAPSAAGLPSAAGHGREPDADFRESEPDVRDGSGGGPGAVRLAALALFLAGFAALGLEIVWFRLLISILGAYRAVFSIVLTVVLLGIWLGALLGGAAHRRWGRPALLYALTQSLFAVSTLGLAAGYESSFIVAHANSVLGAYEQASQTGRWLMDVWANVRVALLLLGLPSVCLGCTFPLANALVQRSPMSVGATAGALYLANTAGNVAGALLAGFLLLPLFGIQGCLAIFVSCAVIGVLPLLAIARHGRLTSPRVRWGALVGPAAAVCALVAFEFLPGDFLLRRSFDFTLAARGERILATHEGVNETLLVSERGAQGRRLHTNGHPMSSTLLLNQRYMRAAAHIPLLLLEAPGSVLNIAFGVGNTLHAASLHPTVERLEVADLSRAILEHARFFASSNQNVLADSRVSVFINDGRQHLLMRGSESYDLITLEPPPITLAGTASLYTREFYELARSRLRPGGFMSQWLPAHQLPAAATFALIRAFVDVFPESVLLGSYRNLILLGVRGPSIEMDIEQVALRLGQRPAVKADLNAILMGTPTELVGTFVASRETLERLSRPVKPLVDDHPINEYAARSNLLRFVQPRELFDLSDAAGWCPKCFSDKHIRDALADLPEYLEIMQEIYWSEAFLVEASRRPPPLFIDQGSEQRRRAVARSPFLRMMLPRLSGSRRRVQD